MLWAVCFSIVAETPSGLVALDLSKLERSCFTPSMVHRSSSGHTVGLSVTGSQGDRGGREVLKQAEKKEFSRLALSLSVVAETLLWDKVKTEQADLLRYLIVQSHTRWT